MTTNPIRGVLAPLLTPFNDDSSVATDLYVAHALWLLEQGCAGLVPFGTTGEALSVGIDAIWLDRIGSGWPVPHGARRIATLAELPELIGI